MGDHHTIFNHTNVTTHLKKKKKMEIENQTKKIVSNAFYN